jgi:mRNA interferase MazF
MSYKKQDIILVPFPFADQTGNKKRPAVIISLDSHYNRYKKYVCVAITSQENKSNTDRYEYKLNKTKEVGLIYDDQWSLPNKVFTIEDRLIIKKLGVMDQNDFNTTESMFQSVF